MKRKDLMDRKDQKRGATKVVMETLRILSTDEQRGVVGGESAATPKVPPR